MRSPLETGPWLDLDEVSSTQDVAIAALREGREVPGVVFARHQTHGRGRFEREWHGEPGSSLAMTMVFGAYADHPRPWLIGMAVAAAAAGAAHCRLQWPNDLVLEGKKLGGVLTEMIEDRAGRRVPVVGLGINVGPLSFPPELAERATSLASHGRQVDPRELARAVLERTDALPEPHAWQDLEVVWRLFDATAGKRYRLRDGRDAIGLGVGPNGELLCAVDGESTTVMGVDY